TPGEKKAHPTNLTVPLHPNFLDQEVVVGGSLSDKGHTELCALLKRNLDIFAWQPSDMTGVPRSVAEHRLNDCYPLPKIDWKVESLCGYPFKCFLDAYKGYHQIQMAAADEEKTAFHTGQGVYCYTKMPFGLKNAAPKPQEELIMYLSATHGAISAVLLTERGMVQTPVYFISRALQGPELNHSPMEKLVMSRPDATGRLQKWSIMLGEHNITYRPRTSIKGQVLADFLNEIPSNALQGTSVAETQEEPWTLFTDSSSCVDGSGARLILTNPDGIEFTYEPRFQFAASNNEAESEALIVGLRIATQMREDNMIKYLEIAKGLVSGFKTFTISQVPRSKNKKADALSKIASTSFAHLSKQVLVKVLETKSITGKEVTAVIEEDGPTWMTELVNYLQEGTLPEDEKEARKIRLKARQYELMEGILYKRSFLTPWLRCVGPFQAEYVIKEIHEGSCSMHAGPRSVVAKAIRLGYFLPTMHRDAQDMIRKCNDCQGIDIAGPFPEGPGKVKFLIVAMDYFTKWIKAKAVATITDGQVKKFKWDNIVCRFALQSLKDLKLPLLDQLEGLKDAPMDVIMASLYLEDDTGDDAPQFIRDLRPSSSQLAIPIYPEVRDPRNPWACTEEIKLVDAIAANISRAEQKNRSRIVCRTHGVGSAHHARSDRVPVSAPIVVPQGLALILVDAATQTDPDA
nr:reverse transcriptase domain-containing protein [Tanacetum cinerariifolium]